MRTVHWPFLRAGLSDRFWVQPAVLFNTMRANTDLLTDSRLTKEDHEPRSVINPQTSTNPEHTCASVPPIAMEFRFKCRNWLCLYFMFQFPCSISLYYIKNQQDATLAVLFISNCKITLHVRTSKVGCHCSGNRPWTSLLDIYHPDPWYAPVAATTVLSTPDDGRRKRPKHVEWSCSY